MHVDCYYSMYFKTQCLVFHFFSSDNLQGQQSNLKYVVIM